MTLAGARSGAMMAIASMSFVQLGLAVSVHLFGQLGPLGVAGLRLGWAGVLLLVLVRPRLRHFARADLLACGVLGVVTAALTLLFTLAIARIPLGTASALEFLGPLGVSLGRPAGGSRRWAVPAAAGVVLLTQPWHGGADRVGTAFALGAAACWAAYIMLTQHVGDRVTGLSGLAISMPVAGIVALLAAGPDLSRVTWPLLAIMLGLAVVHPVVPFTLEFLALRRLTASAFGTLMSLEPAIALLAGLLLLSQVPGAVSAVGIILVVIAGIGATRTGGRSSATEYHRDSGGGGASGGPCESPGAAGRLRATSGRPSPLWKFNGLRAHQLPQRPVQDRRQGLAHGRELIGDEEQAVSHDGRARRRRRLVRVVDAQGAGERLDQRVAVERLVPARGGSQAAGQHLLGVVRPDSVGMRALEQFPGHGAQHDRELLPVHATQVVERVGECGGIASSRRRHRRVNGQCHLPGRPGPGAVSGGHRAGSGGLACRLWHGAHAGTPPGHQGRRPDTWGAGLRCAGT